MRAPSVYEINTWVWLYDLRRDLGRSITLASVPAEVWDRIAALGFDAVWFMGVWERSPAGIAIANQNAALCREFAQTLPDYRVEDNVGSAYCIRNYTVAAELGGPRGLQSAREELARRGLRLILDFVPNHVAPDHPWAFESPEYFISGDSQDLTNDPRSFTQVGNRIYACGRDPNFPAWRDVLQLNAFAPALRQAATATLLSIAAQCDGVRCDMAMLMLNEIFQRTWQQRAGKMPATEYWREAIGAVKSAYPDFLFIAEAYWDLEWTLQQLGFDFCYDKRLYDRLSAGSAEQVMQHLHAGLDYPSRLIRFTENHDEPRAIVHFEPAERALAASVAAWTLPGARLIHEGQLEGRRVHVPVFLRRRPDEALKGSDFRRYEPVLRAIADPSLRDGQWQLCERSGWPDNGSFANLLAWSWHTPAKRFLIVVNLSAAAAQGRIHVPWPAEGRVNWQFRDMANGQVYSRSTTEAAVEGCFVDLPAYGFHLWAESSSTSLVPHAAKADVA
jgi:hypothetical protein